eukprot:scaffold2858_cov659-Pavlova_lutheri.AAC.187
MVSLVHLIVGVRDGRLVDRVLRFNRANPVNGASITCLPRRSRGKHVSTNDHPPRSGIFNRLDETGVANVGETDLPRSPNRTILLTRKWGAFPRPIAPGAVYGRSNGFAR